MYMLLWIKDFSWNCGLDEKVPIVINPATESTAGDVLIPVKILDRTFNNQPIISWALIHETYYD